MGLSVADTWWDGVVGARVGLEHQARRWAYGPFDGWLQLLFSGFEKHIALNSHYLMISTQSSFYMYVITQSSFYMYVIKF
jgi:hypothetical protein